MVALMAVRRDFLRVVVKAEQKAAHLVLWMAGMMAGYVVA
jgi:hypothetical protein